MGFNVTLNFRYSNTHENRFWNNLVSALNKEFADSDEQVVLIGNLLAEGREIDALLIKEDALVVIDFKDYGGELTISENEPWTISGTIINSSRKNCNPPTKPQ